MRPQSQKGLRLSTLWKLLHCNLLVKLKNGFSFPLKFTLPYKICLLEQCLAKDYETEKNRQWLERCWQITVEPHETAVFERSAGVNIVKEPQDVTTAELP